MDIMTFNLGDWIAIVVFLSAVVITAISEVSRYKRNKRVRPLLGVVTPKNQKERRK